MLYNYAKLYLSGSSIFCAIWLSGWGDTTSETTDTTTTNTESTSAAHYETIGTIERLDPALDAILSEDAQIEILGEGMTWAEGPLWIADKEWLLFTDVPENRIHRWTEEDGMEIYLEPSGFTGDTTDSREPGANGLTLDAEGYLVLCQHGNRQVARMKAPLDAPKPAFESIVADYQGKRLNSPNDLIFDTKGNLYFTDPPYGLKNQADDAKKELPFQGVFLEKKDGELVLLTDQLSRPNGIALSPDEKTLYVANSDPKKALWMAYPVNPDGTIGEGRIFYDATELVGKDPGLPDGLKVDDEGNVYATGPGGVWVFSPEGKVLGKIKTGNATANCGFNADKSVLFMTADAYLMRVRLKN